MNVEPGSALPAPSEARVRWFEKAVRITFPEEFRDWLGTANGAVPRDRIFMQGDRERLIERFLPILDDPTSDEIQGQYDIAAVATQLDTRLSDGGDRIGLVLVPFAALFAGDFVCLDYRAGGPQPSVGVWDHELSDDFAPHVETVAPSFAEFLRQLRP
jgi:hypothetical protein